MNDVLFHIYSHTGDPNHLATARRFNGWVFTAPLAAGQDRITKLPFPHANFHLPEIIGNARGFELTSNLTDNQVAKQFFAEITTNHSYCTGGSNSGECWQEARDLGAFLTTQTEESCTQYNILKIARHLFQWEADPVLAEYYERAILNGIVGNQNRLATGATSYIYMLPLGGVVTKPWGKSDFGFPCCWGTLSETFSKLSDSIFFASPAGDTIYVNQFVSADLTIPNSKARLHQKSAFPASEHSTTTLTVSVPDDTVKLTLRIRVPSWTKAPIIKLNGESLPWSGVVPGRYSVIDRMWKDGDTVEAYYPMHLWSNPLNDYHPEYNATMAFMYGPLVLAGVYPHSDIFVPKGDSFQADPASFITRNSSTALEFEAVAANGTKLKMIALNEVMLEPYVVYFMTAGTKPPQPKVYYCPHSAKPAPPANPLLERKPLDKKEEEINEQSLVSAGPPAAAPVSATFGSASKRGVKWNVVDGIMHPATLGAAPTEL